jgi:predicted ester cyclase
VRSYLASFASRDPDAIAAHVAEGFLNDHASALGTASEGRSEYRRRLPGFLEQMPELRYDVGPVVREGRWVAAPYELTARPDDHRSWSGGSCCARWSTA